MAEQELEVFSPSSIQNVTIKILILQSDGLKKSNIAQNCLLQLGKDNNDHVLQYPKSNIYIVLSTFQCNIDELPSL